MRNLLLLLLAIGAIYGLTRWQDGRAPVKAEAPTVDARPFALAPDFAFTDLKGTGHTLRDFRGRVVLLNFWASWCAPCKVEFPAMIELAGKNPDRLVWLAISVDKDEAALARFLNGYKLGANIYVARDPQRLIAEKLFGSYRYPETIILAPDQTMRRKIVGTTDWLGPAMQAELESLK